MTPQLEKRLAHFEQCIHEILELSRWQHAVTITPLGLEDECEESEEAEIGATLEGGGRVS